ncbi:MarR family transcriptional regulator [Mycobacterium antarcticum]|uniref:MarR family winged helix-turn-helix transcriptional regulator n=1 Tax=Mycolicibacterium sp. TUM20985 TaxID=3023370 RepID=UPI00257283C6|nr:MarR family transcriptional regulator [Mycolicibacterium sp. TUM20985]BDX35288.1 MarR family transcriptional regulator [Mycolicibacterium sp. TUM20985]
MKSTDDGELHDRVLRLTQQLVAAADKVSDAFVAVHRMHPTDMNALIYVLLAQQLGEPVTAGSLGEELGLTSGAVTAVVDRLERSGNLRRVRDEQDRRRVLLENSPKGRKLTDQYFGPIRSRSDEVMHQFTAGELEVVSRYLAATTSAMTAHRELLVATEDSDGGGITSDA